MKTLRITCHHLVKNGLLTLWTVCALGSVKAFAQDTPLMQGELEIIAYPVGVRTTILVQAVGTVYDTRCNWYQANSQLTFWRKTSTDFYRLRFVDREQTCPHSPPDTPRIGYGLYLIAVGGDYMYLDFRDADYGTLTGYVGYEDIKLSINIIDNTNVFIDENNHRQISPGQVYHVWDQQPKNQTAYPLEIPVTVRNSFQGGSVKINDVSNSVPIRQFWPMNGNTVKLEAISPQQYYGTTYYFTGWSDGGSRIHYVSPDQSIFAAVLTANYTTNPPITLGDALQSECYPNPCNPTATIRFSLPKQTFASIQIFNAAGQKVATLVNQEMEAGTHEVEFDGTCLSSGVYFYRIWAGNQVQSKKFVLIK